MNIPIDQIPALLSRFTLAYAVWNRTQSFADLQAVAVSSAIVEQALLQANIDDNTKRAARFILNLVTVGHCPDVYPKIKKTYG